MFSWKNIKDTYNEKVKNSDSTGDKALGILEVFGKSIVSGTTAVVKEIPSLVNQIVDEKSNETKGRAEKILNDSNSSSEKKEKAREYLENHNDIKQKLKENKQKIEQSSLQHLDANNIEKWEKSNSEKKISNAERCINKYTEQIKKLEQKKQTLEQRLTNLDATEVIKCQEDIDKVSNALVDYIYKVNKNQKDIEKYTKKLEVY